MVPAPPARLSTMTLTPIDVVSSCATARATISEVPPGANGTTRRMVWLG